jgi:hypothetical protein
LVLQDLTFNFWLSCDITVRIHRYLWSQTAPGTCKKARVTNNLTPRVMCIIYFAFHQACNHHHFLGAWNCGLNCPTNSRHIFHLEDSGFDCHTCVVLRGETLDPDINTVAYYPPRFDTNELPREEGKPKDYVISTASLSDPDSLTSEWQYNFADMLDDGCAGYVQQDVCPAVLQDNYVQPQMTPRTAAHRNLVQDQLKKLPFVGHAVQPYIPPPPMVMFYGLTAWQTTRGSLPCRAPQAPENGKDETQKRKG